MLFTGDKQEVVEACLVKFISHFSNCGASEAGKSAVCHEIMHQLGIAMCVIYKQITLRCFCLFSTLDWDLQNCDDDC